MCAVAKRDLAAGEVLDDYGHFMTYGQAVSAAERQAHDYLPQGLVEGCRLTRDIKRDEVIRCGDVVRPEGRLADRLFREQAARFSLPAPPVGGAAPGSPAAVSR